MANSTRMAALNERLYPWLVWLLRIAIGATFIFSGFTKEVDPWGFVYKIEDYLNVWGIQWIWREVVVCVAMALPAVEFVCGVMLLGGCLRRAVVQTMLLIMCFMLPLSVYIAAASPVADCGCFGEAYIISNTATLLKNVAITLGLVYLLPYNYRVPCLFNPLVQWLVIVASCVYCLYIGFVGFTVQPLVDFRPYKVGQRIIEGENDDMSLIYFKDGVERAFALDNLPDSTWTYIRREIAGKAGSSDMVIFDGEDEVTTDVLVSDGTQLLLVVNEPEVHSRARAGMQNSLYNYMDMHDGSMIAVVGCAPDSLQRWVNAARPQYEVFTSDDTMLKQLVRGDAGLVYLQDGVIKWKRNIFSLPGDFPDFEAPGNQMDTVTAVDSGHNIRSISMIYLSVLAFIFLIQHLKLRKNKKLSKIKQKIS